MRLHNRQIKGAFWNDPDLLQWPREKRWFYIGLTQLADDSGCVEDSPFAFKVILFPSPLDSDITPDVLAEWREELIEQKKLVRYGANGKAYLFIVNFHRHQSFKVCDPPSMPLPPWVTWQPYPSDERRGKYVVNYEMLGSYLKEKDETDKVSGFSPKILHNVSESSPDVLLTGTGTGTVTGKKNNLYTCASPDDDARASNGQFPTANNPVDPDEQITNGRAAGQDPGGSVEAKMVTATPGEQRAKTPLEDDDEGVKPNKPRPPFTSKKQEQLFDQFWELYPKKKSKGQAEKVWARLRPNDELFASIIAGLERAKASYDWQKEGGKYIPYPATWLNAKGWEDEYTPVEEVNRGNGTYQQSFIKPGVTKSLDEARRNRFAGLYENAEG